MKEIIFIPIKTNKKLNPFLFKLFLFLKLIYYCLLEICNNRDNPFLINNECVQSCEEEEINNNLCIIENEIIKTQYLNNIIYIKEENIAFLNIEVSENNNLYYILSNYPASNTRIFYMINNEGYGLFNKDNPYYKIEIDDPKTLGRFESIFFSFKLLSDQDNKEYLINIGKSSQLAEIYDFYLNKIYLKNADNILGITNIFHYVGAHLKLKKNENTYLMGLSASEYIGYTQYNYFFLKKGYFTSLDINNISPTFETQREPTTDSKIVSCYETSKNFIVCFYQNQEYKYIMIVYDYDLIEQASLEIAEGVSSSGYDQLFFKCIHFFEETGVFGYFNNEENRKIIFKFKKYLNNEINDYYSTISELSIDDIFFNYDSVKGSDMIKIQNKKFYYVGISLNQEILYIISIYNYYNENFVTRIYSINLKNLYNYTISLLSINLYKNLLVLCSKNDVYDFPTLIIFSYPNTNEIDLDLFEYLYNNNNIKINNLLLKLKGEYIIENNLFGYVYSGILIIENCNDEYIYLTDLNNEKVSGYFLPKNEEIKLLIPKSDIYSPFICNIKYASVVTEPEFSEYNKYPINIIYNGGNENEEKSFFKKKKLYR